MNVLKNDNGHYPWQVVDPIFGIMYFAGIPFVVLLPDGIEDALIGFGLGMVFLVLFTILFWVSDI